MDTKRAVVVAALGVVLAGGSAAAHHAFSAEFDSNRPLTLSGTVTKTEWVNPHAWIYIDVKKPDGAVARWAVEMGPPNALLRRGWKRASLPVGSQITVEGYGAKRGRDIINAIDVTFPDGTKIFAGSSGTGAPREGQR